jgi:hypothetical protein
MRQYVWLISTPRDLKSKFLSFVCASVSACEIYFTLWQDPVSSANVKGDWSYTSTSPLCLRVMDRDKFTIFTWLGLIMRGDMTSMALIYDRFEVFIFGALPLVLWWIGTGT